MICKKCGAVIPEDMKFCGQCGAKVDETIQQPTFPQNNITTPINFNNPVDETIIKHEEATSAPIFSLLGLFSIKGRRGRLKAWGVGVLQCVLFAVFGWGLSINSLLISYGALLLCVVIGATNLVKRLHDIDKSGKWGAALYGCGFLFALSNAILNPTTSVSRRSMGGSQSFIPLIFNLIFLIGNTYIFLKSGTEGSNRFGRSLDELKQGFR